MAKLFVAQIAAGLIAAVIFQIGLDSRYAGLIAGSSFIAVGIFGIFRVWPVFRRGGAWKWVSFLALAMAVVHLFGIAIPMVGFRIANWDQPFTKVAVWGLSGPEFHALSTRFYASWVIVVLAGWLLTRKKDPGESF